MRTSKKIEIFTATALGALLLALSGTASAQDGPTITLDPPAVDAPGPVDVTVTGSGWTLAPELVPCPGYDGDDSAFSRDTATLHCDLAVGVQVILDGDSFEVTLTVDVPAEGLVIGAGGQFSGTETATGVVTVGAAEAAPAEAELATTGAETGVLAIIGIGLVGGGLLIVANRRQLI
jgi:LPXTG-motif cell wall-anchored protein